MQAGRGSAWGGEGGSREDVCYDLNLTISQWDICALVIMSNPLAYLATPHHPSLLICSIYILHSRFPVVNPHPWSPTPGLFPVLFLPSSIKPHIMYLSSSVWNHITSHIILCISFSVLQNLIPPSLFSSPLNLSLSICPKYRDRMSVGATHKLKPSPNCAHTEPCWVMYLWKTSLTCLSAPLTS